MSPKPEMRTSARAGESESPLTKGVAGANGAGQNASAADAKAAKAPDAAKKKPKVKLKQVLPDVWELIKPRRALLGFGLLLMAVNRISGLVLPWSTKSLIDDVINKHQSQKLFPLIAGVAL